MFLTAGIALTGFCVLAFSAFQPVEEPQNTNFSAVLRLASSMPDRRRAGGFDRSFQGQFLVQHQR